MKNHILQRWLTISISVFALTFVAGLCTNDPAPTPKQPTTSTPTTPTTPSTPSTGQRTTTKWTGGDTFFLALQKYRFSKYAEWHLEEFKLTKSTNLVFNFATQYKSQAAIITPDQVDNFKNNRAFSGFAIFDQKMGITAITLNAGTYYVACRNFNSGSNTISYELDYTMTLPASDRCRYYDIYINDYDFYTSGSRMWHPFTIQSGYRYFIEGCNTGMNVFFIPGDQIDNFRNRQEFKHYPDFKQGENSGGDPGGVEITLPPGNYYLVAINETNESQSMVYAMQRWQLY
jgi:hypothetical protein